MIELTKNHINVSEVIRKVECSGAGGIDVFIGVVRDVTEGKKVIALEFEAYENMAVKEFEKIIDQAKKKWPVFKIAVSHAVGRRNIGELAVVIAVSAPHRDEAFQACRFVIDTLKKTVPIWKKEIFDDGEVWVSAHP